MKLVARKTSRSCDFRVGFLARSAVVALMLGGSVTAAPPAYAQSAQIDIKAQPLGDALVQLARQANVDISVRPDVTRGKQAPAVQGAMIVDAALDLLLEGSGLSARKIRDRSFVVEPAGGGGKAGSAATETGDAVPADQLASEIVVTGSIIRGAAPSGANLTVLARKDLDNTGRGTLAEAIQTVPQVHGGGANGATTRTNRGAAPNSFGNAAAAGSSSLNLRGLGVEETLTLVNGRRLAPAGYFGSIADISVLPMAAVERVEILADGASATYGADAMAGVVNIIMNRHFEGAETHLRAGIETRSGQPEVQASQTFGWAFDRGNILLSADYAQQAGITSKGRPYAASEDLRPFGGSDHRQPYCSPGNVFDSAGGLIGAIPAGQDGTALTPDQVRTGETNKCDRFPEYSHLIPESEKGSLYLAGSYDVTDRLRLGTDVIAAKRSSKYIDGYYDEYLSVPVSNAFRQMNGLRSDTPPFDQTIAVNYLFTEIDPIEENSDAWSLLASVSADYGLGRDWHLSIHGSYGHYDSKGSTRQIDARPASEGGALERALGSSDLATAFNPFGDGSANQRGLVESFFYSSENLQESDYRAVSLNLNGSLIALPGGDIKLAVGTDYRRERLEVRSRSFYDDLAGKYLESYAFNAHRDIAAAYAELFIPIVSNLNSIAGARQLSFSLSGRYDHYSDFGGTLNPKAGVTWMPARGLTLKGSYGSSFKAPLLPSLYDQSNAGFFSFGFPQAPDLNGDGYTTVMYLTGGNPNLGPEKGRSWNIGLEIAPQSVPELRFYATYFNIGFSGRFAQAPLGLVFTDPAAYEGIAYFPHPTSAQVDTLLGSVGRIFAPVPPVGSIEAIIDTRAMNFASQVMDGIDAGASYQWSGLGGTFSLNGDVSYLSRYNSRLGQSVVKTSYLNNVGVPAHLKARGGLSWSNDRFGVNGWINYVGRYRNKISTPHEPVEAYTTIDLSLQARLGVSTSMIFFVTNLFDEAPPFVNNPAGVGYDGANADPIGRRVSIKLVKKW